MLASRREPVLAEVDDSLTLDPEDVARKLTPEDARDPAGAHARRARGHGRADARSPKEHGLAIVEDVCQAAGAIFQGQRLGTFGDAGAFSLQFNKIITTGEGGVMITDREDLYDLAIDVHDCAGSVRRGSGCRSSPAGTSAPRSSRAPSRACSCRGSTACSSGCARTTRELAERVGALPGLTLRRANDDGGDAGICLIAFAQTAALAADAVDALRAEGVTAMQIYRPDVDRPPRLPVLEAGARRDRRSRAARRPTARARSTCSSRTIHVDVSPLCDEQDLEEISLAFKKVAHAVLA